MADEKFTALGLDNGEGSHVEMHHADTAEEIGRWISGYIKNGFGGYDGIAVIDPDGDWVCVFEAQ